ncbi:MAG: aromatic-ring-hydroxylating dioxygenase subunit beta [Pigmentiphaga sp.]|uniref:Aromatic-ring-hydroxylating dioxygenase subunit beta n=1 Tax=Pigmentiphaga daeguensis TaxID=414049 RepID=A0ABP3N5I9_9BURK
MNVSNATREALAEFIYEEARLLDEKRLDQWQDLFTSDGVYWIPLGCDQQDPVDHASITYEDRLLLKLRIDRLQQPRAYSQQPASRCLHVLQLPRLEGADGRMYRMRTPMIYCEARGDEQWTYAAVARHELVPHEDTFRIRLKRVDLLNGDAPLPAIQLFP